MCSSDLMLKHLEGHGIVALTVRAKDSIVIMDKDGNRLAVVAPSDQQLGKVKLIIQAPKEIRIHRETIKHEAD